MHTPACTDLHSPPLIPDGRVARRFVKSVCRFTEMGNSRRVPHPKTVFKIAQMMFDDCSEPWPVGVVLMALVVDGGSVSLGFVVLGVMA